MADPWFSILSQLVLHLALAVSLIIWGPWAFSDWGIIRRLVLSGGFPTLDAPVPGGSRSQTLNFGGFYCHLFSLRFDGGPSQ